MELVSPATFDEAIRKIGERSPVGSTLRSAEWQRVPVAIRERSFFSSTIESGRWLQERLNFIQDTLANTTAVNERGERYFVAGGRAKFIELAQTDAIRSGLGPLDPEGTIKDIRSAGRLGLIYDTNLKAAEDYGTFKQGNDPDVLEAFPAQRFVRVAAVRKPRPYHQAALNQVRRKDDLKFWISLNRDFGVPWGPWGYNSGCDVLDVGRAESDRLGLTKPNEPVVSDGAPQLTDQSPVAGSGIRRADADFNARLKASLNGLSSRLVDYLRAAFGNQVTFEDDSVSWNLPEGEGDLPPPEE